MKDSEREVKFHVKMEGQFERTTFRLWLLIRVKLESTRIGEVNKTVTKPYDDTLVIVAFKSLEVFYFTDFLGGT